MGKSILVGPVPGIPVSDSIALIVSEILDKVPNAMALYSEYVESYSANHDKGIMLVNIKPQKESDIDDVYIPLAKKVQEVSRNLGRQIICTKVDRGFEMGDNEGDVPFTPPLGPRNGPPALEDIILQAEENYLAHVDLRTRPADWWQQKQNLKDKIQLLER